MISDKHIDLYRSILDDKEERTYTKWHGSSIHSCPRAAYFERKGVKPIGNQPSAAKLLRWGAGHLIEEVIRPHVHKLYGEVESNLRLETDNLSGEMDNWTGKRIVEIKSVHDYAMKEKDGITALKLQVGTHPNGNKKWDLKEDPYLHHQWQNHFYTLLAKHEGMEVEGIDYVYITLSGRVVVYETDVDQQILNDVAKRIQLLERAWKAQEPPECICLDESSKNYDEFYGAVYKWCDYLAEDGSCCELGLLEGVE